MSYPMLRAAYAGTPPPRSPTSHPAIAPYGAHRTGDGQVIFGLQNEREWATFCTKVLERPDVQIDPRFATQHARRENRTALTALIEDYFGTMTSLEVVRKLDDNGIANGRLNEPKDVWDHVQFAARDKWRDINTEAGPVRALMPPFMFSDHEPVMGDVPSLGQHTSEVLTELGYSEADIGAMRASEAI
jgi:crotonobetainyl-CoA:carnitine CoA-transferase CaiB-like acyl-CoA transferase